ncbi:hypothetical protein Glove_537g4 [Diversispora epigaea]|uniref:Uncharacterized protein n=1 Tax=Diversispora epigaea TaxID=1348612 RepID=A0A397GHH7_9GLOM|nr:hypothetical protein Glove_537g4 [Diversispora epigaea]
MRESFSDFGTKDTINWVDRSSPLNSPPNSPDLKPSKKILAPMQDNQDLKETFFNGNDLVIEYFVKINKCNKLFGYNKEQLRYQFFRGLSYDNQLEVRRCGLEFPLEELVERLSAIENIWKMHSKCA